MNVRLSRLRLPRRAQIALALAAVALAALALTSSPFAASSADSSAPAFVQQVSKRGKASSITLQPASAIGAGNRLVVEVGVWSSGSRTASAVSDTAGNTYTELTHFTASDHTELSVWSAPITAGGGTKPTITVTATGSADIGAGVLEYSGLSTLAGAAAADQIAHATATSGSGATTVSAGPTAPTTAAGELALGFYGDSGFNDTLTGDPTYATRINVSPTGDMEFLAQDQLLGGAGATPNPTTTTGRQTPWLAATVVFKTAAPAPPPSVPGAPTAPSATAGDGSATVAWTPPSDGGSPITGYTVTPYAGSTPQTPKTVSGATTGTTIAGLTNGTAYTFTVSATNAIGTGTESAASNAVTPTHTDAATPAFVQQVNKRAAATAVDLVPASPVAAGNRVIVEAAMWSAGNAVATGVSDSAGNTYAELTHFTAPDHTELSVWTAPIAAGGGTKPTITVTASGRADIGATALEYSGLSTAGGAGAVDQVATASGTSGSSATQVSSSATGASAGANELALGVYADSGFGNALTGDAGYTTRTNVSPTSDMEFLVQDKVLASAGSTADPSVSTGKSTPWLAATVLLKSGTSSAPTAPSAPTSVVATAGNEQATVTWTAPPDGGSPITGYIVTPYVGTTAQAAKTVDGATTSTTVDGLTNGTAYTFTVAAKNAIGTGSPSQASNVVTPGASPDGQWAPLMNWPIVAVHMIELTTGNVLAFDGWQQPQPTFVWDSTSQTFPTTLNAPSSIFCAGNALLPDGRVLTIGGDGVYTTGNLGLADTNIFDPAVNRWTRVADMNKPRWYPTLTELPDGRYVAISGNSTNDRTWADTPEVYDPKANTWTLVSGVSTPQVHEEEYPFSYLVPNGKVFTIGTEEDNSFFLDVDNHTWTQVGGASGVVNGSSVMYRPGKVLYTGGAASVDTAAPSHASSALIDLNAATPAWRQVAPMHNNRIYHTLTMLADGRVLALGGESSGDQSVVTSGVLQAETWDPDTETWSTAAPMAAARNYHSTAMLMPDGRVLVAGGGHYQDGAGPGQYSAQIYSPSYLFAGPRPTVASAPDATTYGQDINVSTPDAASIRSVNLVSLAADTHQSDMDQHFVPLSFDAGSGSLTVHGPATAALAPPGHYMLFIVNDKGVPSVAKIISVTPSLTRPATPAAPQATAGDGQARVSWTAPDDGGSAITGYTVTPYAGPTALAPKTVPGSATSTTVDGLTNGTAYTFTVKATNSVGTSDESPGSNAVTPVHSDVAVPAFVQQVNKRGNASSITLQPTAAVAAGDRMIVETGTWSSGSATASAVTDSAGNTYTELTHFTASEHTELTVWSAPITAGDGTRPTITVTATKSADIGATALEYSGLSSAAGPGVLDVLKTASGTTGTAGSTAVSSGVTPASTGPGELALGFYVDSGFGDSLSGDPAYTTRTNVSPTSDMELLVQDKMLGGTGATASPTVTTGARTTWLAATLVLKPGAAAGGDTQAMAKAAAAPALRTTQASAAAPLVYSFTPVANMPTSRVQRWFLCPFPQAFTKLTDARAHARVGPKHRHVRVARRGHRIRARHHRV